MPSLLLTPAASQAIAASRLRLIQDRPAALAEGSMAAASEAAPVLDVDRDFSRTLAAIGGETARVRIHALHPARFGDEGAVTGFAFSLIGHLAAIRRAQTSNSIRCPILWVQDRSARREAGRPYGLGFAALGLDPSQFVIVSTKTALDALAAAEIGLEIGGLDGVIAELPSHLPADMLALGKRLALRAERSATLCLLLHASAVLVPAPVATRWQVASCAAVPGAPYSAPQSAVDLALIKNRFGPTGRWSAVLAPASHDLGAEHVRVPNLPAPLSRTVDATPADRSGAAAARPRAA